ncbi:MAG: acriflavin resistance protein [[Candidatus Thermochlorobacteriaceae] bacterium GBChlB]|nr:MAG: acriflavin resistance protein [[Candidatus Thermochlorobacteriaceae] bacterium GBChlB]
MSLSEISIRRPVLAIVMSLTIILFGIIGFTYLGIREYPAIDPPVINVSTSYTGANADIIESQITEPLEESINGAAGIRTLTSSSSDGRSNITVEFNLDVDLEAAANDVRDRVSRAVRSLPPDADPPVISKADANADPIMGFTLQSNSRNLLELSDYARNTIKERLQTVSGVSEVSIWGERRFSMRLWLDPTKLSAYGLTPLDVRNALNTENIELPSGRIEGNSTELSIRTMGRLEKPDEFNELIIKETDGKTIRLKDVGRAELGPENERSMLRRDGIPMVVVVIVPQPGANNIAIADEVYKRIAIIKKDLPKDLTIDVSFDATEYIRASIGEVEETLIIAFGLVVLIIFLFLRDWRSTLIPVLAIPISLIGVFFIMYVMNFSINVLTLLGIVLAIGLVVDDAIVVLENIYAKIEDGMSPIEAGLKGSKEIFFAVISTTIVLAAVFLPVIFLQGITGRLFREFGIVVAGSVLISAFVALTLTPMLSTRLLKPHHGNRFYELTEPFFIWLTAAYKDSLASFMKHRWLGLVVMAASVALIFGVGSLLKSELAPLEDRSSLRISVTAPEGTSFEYMDQFMMGMYDVVKTAVPENNGVITVTASGRSAAAVNSGIVRIILKDPEERTRTQQQIADNLQQLIRNQTVARSFVVQEQTIGGGVGKSGLPVQYVVRAPDLDKLKETLPKFLDAAQKSPVFGGVVDVNLKFTKPEIQVLVNREKARNLGVSIADVAQTLQSAFSGQRFGYFIMNGKQYQVIGQLARENRDEPLDLKSIFVKSRSGDLIQLDNLVSLSEQSSPPQLFRYDRYVSATVSAGLAKGMTMGDAIAAMDAIAKETLDESCSTALAGTTKDFAESSSSLLFAFGLALLLIYLILAAQFESFRDPLTIFFTVPLALAGALFALWYFNQTLNIFSQIGIIMLIGLVTKNGILIVEFANQRKDDGLKLIDAVQDAAVSRFRPILMTSLATILGFLPIALALGAGAESRVSMGIAVVGGMIFSTALTLYVVPSIYSYLSTDKKSIDAPTAREPLFAEQKPAQAI